MLLHQDHCPPAAAADVDNKPRSIDDVELGLPQQQQQQSPTQDPPKDPKKPTPVPPPSARQAWTQAACLHFVFFNTWGVANGFGVFQQYYVTQRFPSLGQSAVSWIGSLQVFLLFFVGFVSGRATDAGFFFYVFRTGVFLQLLGIFMTSLVKRDDDDDGGGGGAGQGEGGQGGFYQIILAQAVCVGLGNGLTFSPALTVLSGWFEDAGKRALAVGVASAGAAVGGLVYPILVDRLVYPGGVGFGWTLRAMGLVMLVTYVPCLVLMKPRFSRREKEDRERQERKEEEEEEGGEEKGGGGEQKVVKKPWVDWSTFKEPPFVFFSLSFFFIFWGLYFAFFYLGTFARDRVGVSDTIPLIMILNGVGVLGRIGPNMVAGRWLGLLNSVIVASLVASLLVYCWAAVETTGGLYAFTVVYGLVAASLQALLPATSTTMTPSPLVTGTRVGMIMFFVSFATLTGPSICGAIIRGSGGSYVGAQMFAASSILVGCVFATCARIAKTGFKLKVKV